MILGLVLMLLIVGLLIVYSSSFALGILAFDNPNYFVFRQAIWAAIGVAGMLVLMRIDYRWLRAISPLLMLIAIVGLVAVLVPGLGLARNGAQRWTSLRPRPGPPSELA